MKQIKPGGFVKETISSETLNKIETALNQCSCRSEKKPYYIVFQRDPSLMHDLESFAGAEDAHLSAPLVIMVFADMEYVFGLSDTLQILGEIQKVLQEEGLDYFFSTALNDTVNMFEYRKIKETFGVPESGVLVTDIAAGHFASAASGARDERSVFSYVQ